MKCRCFYVYLISLLHNCCCFQCDWFQGLKKGKGNIVLLRISFISSQHPVILVSKWILYYWSAAVSEVALSQMMVHLKTDTVTCSPVQFFAVTVLHSSKTRETVVIHNEKKTFKVIRNVFRVNVSSKAESLSLILRSCHNKLGCVGPCCDTWMAQHVSVCTVWIISLSFSLCFCVSLSSSGIHSETVMSKSVWFCESELKPKFPPDYVNPNGEKSISVSSISNAHYLLCSAVGVFW